MPDMHFQKFIVVRRVGDGKGSPAPILEDKFNVLSSKKLQAFSFR